MCHVILRNPLIAIFPSLSGDLDNLGRPGEVNLKVLVPIVHPCAPGPKVPSVPRALEPSEECCVVFIPLRRGCHLSVSKAAVLQSHWLVTKFAWYIQEAFIRSCSTAGSG